MKKIIAAIVVVALVLLAWHYRFALSKLRQNLPELVSSPIVNQIKQDISTPTPLIGSIIPQASNLTQAGVISWTNINRAQNGQLPPLTENAKLDQAAALKLQDMFAQQYFEHVNPQGVGPGDLAKKVQYSFLSEGENLALGNFTNDQTLLEAWMNSPGHRANILNTKYQEIGVAVGKGTYQGHTTWLAVQEFGRPSADCPTVSSSLQSQITAMRGSNAAEEIDLNTQKAYLQSTTPTDQASEDAYNQKVDSFNNEVNDYNTKEATLKGLITQYNNEVNAYNTCLEQ